MRSTINVLRQLSEKEYQELLRKVKCIRDSYYSSFSPDPFRENVYLEECRYPSSLALEKAKIGVAYCALRDRLFDREALHQILAEHHFLE